MENWKHAILELPDVDFLKNCQILSILLAFLSNFWQNHTWQLAKTGHSDPLAKTCLKTI